MQNNYADKIIRDYNYTNTEKADEPDILQNILNEYPAFDKANAENEINGFIDGIKTVIIIKNSADKK